MNDLKNRIQKLYRASEEAFATDEAAELFEALREELNAGRARSAEPDGSGGWRTNSWVKEGILLGFRVGILQDESTKKFCFFDKNNLPLRRFSILDNVRIVPGGSAVRDGAYVAQGVICMPPMYVNIGAYVDAGTMIDSHALVGTCAQVGARVHLSAAAQLGGVLEPVGANPVIIENDVLIGGNCGVYEGTIVRERAVLASGVVLTASSRVYDNVNGTIVTATDDSPLEIPAGAVVVMGTRGLSGDFAQKHGLALSTPVIVKYRDEKTDGKTALEDALR